MNGLYKKSLLHLKKDRKITATIFIGQKLLLVGLSL
jgi:hypothetical protein